MICAKIWGESLKRGVLNWMPNKTPSFLTIIFAAKGVTQCLETSGDQRTIYENIK